MAYGRSGKENEEEKIFGMIAEIGKLVKPDWKHVQDVETFVGMEILGPHFQFSRKPATLITLGNVPEYDIMFEFSPSEQIRVEIKMTRDRWIPVEFASNGKGTGISGTTADLWVYFNVGGTTFDGRGKPFNGHKVEGKINVIKPDTLLQFILDNNDDDDKVRYQNFDGNEVVYINTHALDNRHWFGVCEVELRPDGTNPNESYIHGFDLSTFRREPKFSLSSVIQKYDKLEDEVCRDRAYARSERLVDITNRSA